MTLKLCQKKKVNKLSELLKKYKQNKLDGKVEGDKKISDEDLKRIEQLIQNMSPPPESVDIENTEQ